VPWLTQISEYNSFRLTRKCLEVSGCGRFDLNLNSRLEYLTLAVANAKSHPLSVDARHETAIQFLTDLEEKVEVAQVQLEIYNTLLPHIDDAPEVGEKVQALSKQLMTMNDVSSSSIQYVVFITLTGDV
jgi:nuclear pore complex protein Nup155